MKTIVFDFDGTLTKKSHEIWNKMWEKINCKDLDNKLYNEYKNKKIDYIQWCKEIEIIYKEHNFNESILKDISKDIELMDNLEKTLKILKENNYNLYIISGGVDKVIYSKLGNLVKYFSGIYSCKFEFDSKGKLVHIEPTKYDDEGKKWFIDEYCNKYKINPKDITFIGNGDNDEYVYLSGCHTICINPQKVTRSNDKLIWNKVIKESNNMLDILKYLDI